jgi:hypothetical protein
MTSGCSPIPMYMDSGSHPRDYLFLSMESLSGHPRDSFNPSSSPPQSILVEWGLSDPSSFDNPGPHSWLRRPFVSAHSDVQAFPAGLRPSLNDIHDGDLSPTSPSETDTMCPTMISSVCALSQSPETFDLTE